MERKSYVVSELVRPDFDKGAGLIPAIIQHAVTGAVLMLGYMNREAYEATLSRGRVVFFSRIKGRLWEKGETSGHSLEVVQIHADCDGDALLVTARPLGPTCHLGKASCFGEGPFTAAQSCGFLSELERIIAERIAQRRHGSYTAKLVASGIKRMAQKVAEEGLEVALAAASGTDEELLREAADLMYHLQVMLAARGLDLERVVGELERRHVGAPP